MKKRFVQLTVQLWLVDCLQFHEIIFGKLAVTMRLVVFSQFTFCSGLCQIFFCLYQIMQFLRSELNLKNTSTCRILTKDRDGAVPKLRTALYEGWGEA